MSERISKFKQVIKSGNGIPVQREITADILRHVTVT